MDYTKCKNTYDYITFREWEEILPTLQIRFIEDPNKPPRIDCYDSRVLKEWFSREENIFAKWESLPSGSGMDNMGYGGGPNIQYKYMKLYTNEYIIVDSNLDKLKILMQEGIVISDAIYVGTIRIGNLRGEFGVGDIHGQSPGYRVYQIIGHMITPNIYNMSSLGSFFKTFGINSLDILVEKAKKLGRSWEEISILTFANKEIVLSGEKLPDKRYVLRITEINGGINNIRDIMLFKIKKDILTDITILDIPMIDTEENLLPRILDFEGALIEELEEFLLKFDYIHDITHFIDKYLKHTPVDISDITGNKILATVSLREDDGSIQLSIEKDERGIFSLRLLTFIEEGILSKLILEFKLNSNTGELYDFKKHANFTI